MFGGTNERRRQWTLLGRALKGLPLLDALDLLDRSFGSKLVPWARFREEAAAGRMLSEAARDPELKTPADVLSAIEDGEKDGRVPERLAGLDLPDEEGPTPPVDHGPVTLVNALLLAATEGDATGLMLKLLPTGDGQVKFYRGDAWTLHSRHPADEFRAMVRRLLVLCGKPYWAPESGSFRMRMRQGDIEVRVTPDGQGGAGIEIVPANEIV